MQRYRLDLSYDGTDFFGWQRQPKEISIQETIELNLSRLFSNMPISVVGCGRTDTGVHAKHYVLHTDLPEEIEEEKFKFKLNRMLPHSIAVQSISLADDSFHARFDAKSRTYRYFVHLKKDPFLDRYSYYIPQKLHFDKMNEAAHHLIGKQDFTSLSKKHTDVKTHTCTVDNAIWKKEKEGWIFEISADRFLRNMVRATVGTLLEVGLGKVSTDEFKTILDAKNRQAAATSAPANALFLWKIEY